MIFVLFEVTVKPEYRGDYFNLAAALRSDLEQAEGFIRAERFKSLTEEGKILSLSVWESEAAVETWRNGGKHRLSQRQGRQTLFERYTITVAAGIRSYTREARDQTPEDSKAFFLPDAPP